MTDYVLKVFDKGLEPTIERTCPNWSSLVNSLVKVRSILMGHHFVLTISDNERGQFYWEKV